VVPDLQEVNVRERSALGSLFGGGKPLQQFLLARLSRIARTVIDMYWKCSSGVSVPAEAN